MLKALPSTRWDFTKAAHLLNRAGFGGPPVEIETLLALGLEQAVSHFVDYEKIQDDTRDPGWAKPDPDRVERFMTARRASEEERRKIDAPLTLCFRPLLIVKGERVLRLVAPHEKRSRRNLDEAKQRLVGQIPGI